MDGRDLKICEIIFKKYLSLTVPIEPNRLGLDLHIEELKKGTMKLHELGLLEASPGFGGFSKFKITPEGNNASLIGLRTYLLKNGIIKPRNLFDSWRKLETNQKITIIGIVVASATALIIAFFSLTYQPLFFNNLNSCQQVT